MLPEPAAEIIETITSLDPGIRNKTFEDLFSGQKKGALLHLAQSLDSFRRKSHNLYFRVRACLYLYALQRYCLIGKGHLEPTGLIPYEGIQAVLDRDFENALEIYLDYAQRTGLNETLCSALAEAYHGLAFKYLVEQVHESIHQSSGNQGLFQTRTLEVYPYRTPDQLTCPEITTGLYPVIFDACAVRMDPSHSGWSDIFFLGMDYPEGARVTNISINLGVQGRDDQINPPIESYCRMIEAPLIRITSADLAESKDILDLEELFNFANDHLGLLKAGIVASGLIPPSLQETEVALSAVLEKLLGKPAGFELTSRVRGIPKGSRLAVSTSLLACIITNCMRFSGQTQHIEGTLTEPEKRLVASRAILGEWLGGSGGGWQDSGGIWPGIKVITGKIAQPDDPEYGHSRGTLLPNHTLFTEQECVPDIEAQLAASIILVHGGMAQNVGPILEMVTEKYLLRFRKEWTARKKGYHLFEAIVQALKKGDMKELGRLTTQNFEECLTPIIPWVSNSYTEEVRDHLERKFGENFWGFLMLGGMTGGGMAFLVNPAYRNEIARELHQIMVTTKAKYGQALPFAMDPVVYKFSINQRGIEAQLKQGKQALMPDEYYRYWIMQHIISSSRTPCYFQNELSVFSDLKQNKLPSITTTTLKRFYKTIFHTDIDGLLASLEGHNPDWEQRAEELKMENGFDVDAHEKMKQDVQAGVISVKGNRMSRTTRVEDVEDRDVFLVPSETADRSNYETIIQQGNSALQDHQIAVVTFAAGLGSRWTSGSGVVKTINPFVKLEGRNRSFAEIHLAKTKRSGLLFPPPQHVFSTSFQTHTAVQNHLAESDNFSYPGLVYLSRAHAIGQRLYPMERDLRFIWEELPQQAQSAHVQKMIKDLHETLITWAQEMGEGEDYNANEPALRFYPPGHWFELPNMIRNGTLARMIEDNPNLNYLLIHNADTLGTWLDPLILGWHIGNRSMLTFETTPRRYEDSGGGLARINGRPQLVEGMALPGEADEYKLRFYNTLTSWLSLDPFLDLLQINRSNLLAALTSAKEQERIHNNLSEIEACLPTYATIKQVKLRWGAGHEDTFPVLQCEKLWGDITSLDAVTTNYVVVPRCRGQQMKNPNLLDRWFNDGSREHLLTLTHFRTDYRK